MRFSASFSALTTAILLTFVAVKHTMALPSDTRDASDGDRGMHSQIAQNKHNRLTS